MQPSNVQVVALASFRFFSVGYNSFYPWLVGFVYHTVIFEVEHLGANNVWLAV